MNQQATIIHAFSQPVSHISLPEKFTYPFHYTPHPLCVLAAEEVKDYLRSRQEWADELEEGKMFGVLVVRDVNGSVGYLAAFSGNLAGKNLHPFFVPPVYNLSRPQGFFKIEEERISGINRRVEELANDTAYLNLKRRLEADTAEASAELARVKADMKAAKAERERRRNSSPTLSDNERAALIKESQHQKASLKRLEREWKARIESLRKEISTFEDEIERLKAERRERSAALQQRLFEQFRMLNARGETKDLRDIFRETAGKVPPAGAGECALPKLLQYAYLHRLHPLAMAEFWWGHSPKTEIRYHGYYYPSCKGKCEPILRHMLQGLEVEENPLAASSCDAELETLFEDEGLLAVNKPAGMLSVPGKDVEADSVYRRMREKYPEATGPLIVHRLDMSTSGLLIIAKTKEAHARLQAQFEKRSVKKRYVALLDCSERRTPLEETGRIELPLCPNPSDRPRQMVNEEYGKPAVTDYRILRRSANRARVLFYPLTGRTHQLRIHAAHPAGLGCPIIGDELYGKKAHRLCLHAEYIEFRHPIYGESICLQKEAEF